MNQDLMMAAVLFLGMCCMFLLNRFAESVNRIGIIRSLFYKEDGKYCCHIQWFQYTSNTILGETANPQALVLLCSCDDVNVQSILQKVSVRRLGPDEPEPVLLSQGDVGSSSFHYA